MADAERTDGAHRGSGREEGSRRGDSRGNKRYGREERGAGQGSERGRRPGGQRDERNWRDADNKGEREGYWGHRNDDRNERKGNGARGNRTNRGGKGDFRARGGIRHDRSNPYREGYREERMAQKEAEPDLPKDMTINDLDPSVLQDLRVLSKENASRVAKHMIMAVDLMEDDPQLALAHARAAKNRAGRVGVVRETAGVVAYNAGEWKEALSELRAARRISGGPGLLAVMADAERGMGRPEKALELGRSPEARELDAAGKVELAIVLAGARHDLGQHESALATLQKMNPSLEASDATGARLAYAYAEALLALDRKDEAKEWFAHVAEVDAEGVTDARDRVAELG